MLQVFQRHVANVCSKCFICFRHVASIFMLQEYVRNVSVFQSYVVISVFMLQVGSVLSGCCICFTHMLQVYVVNVSSALDVCCI